MLWTECSFPYAQWCQKDQTIRDLQSAVADRGIQKCTNTAWDLRKPWMSRVALNGKQIPKKVYLGSGGEEKKNTSSWFMSSSKLGLRSQFYIPHQAAKGTQSSGWPEKQHPPGSLLSRAQAVWSSHSGIVRQRGWKQEKQNICAPTLPLFVT